jgi:Glycosyltransferase family 6
MRIAVVLVATGKGYRKFLEPLVLQVHQQFTTYAKDIFLVSDVSSWPGVYQVLQVEHLPPPLPTLLRHHWIYRLKNELLIYDYVYYLDVDMEILRPIGEEILRPLIAVRHWRWPSRELARHASFERRPQSVASVDPRKAFGYYQASLQGGQGGRYLEATRVLRDRINMDLVNRGKGLGGTIAVWYDESHWNRYVNEHIDEFHILGPEYAQGGPHGSFAPDLLSANPFIRMRAKDERDLWSWKDE